MLVINNDKFDKYNIYDKIKQQFFFIARFGGYKLHERYKLLERLKE